VLRFWDAITGDEQMVFDEGAKAIQALAIRPDGARVAVAVDQIVKLFELHRNQAHSPD
jgi:hypothetical protein